MMGALGCARYDVSTPAEQRYLCDPFHGGNSPGEHYGVRGDIYYLDQTQPQYSEVSKYIEFGHLVEIPLFLNDINVPTRAWESGFVSQNSTSVKNEAEELLIEWFALRLRSGIQLSANDAPGDYQFALLSDDGAVFKQLQSDGSSTVLVDNDGNHPTKMGCGMDRVNFTSNTLLPFNLDWYQGPRNHISLILMWRPYPTNPNDVIDPLCGQSGNGLYFDSTQTPSVPQQAYSDLLSRGWKPLTPENYYLGSEITNPCASQ